jgi:Tfp pilus assembly protein PilF
MTSDTEKTRQYANQRAGESLRACDLKGAKAHLLQAMQADPDNMSAWVNLAEAPHRLRQY